MTQNVLVLGGSSEIAGGIVRRLAAAGPVHPLLLGRDQGRLESAAAELRAAGCIDPDVDHLDAGDVERHADVIGRAFERAGEIDIAILAIGVLGAQGGVGADPVQAREVMSVNFADSGSLLLECLRRLEAQRRGTMIVLSSVAAERPRAGNAVYGAAKAGIDALAQGLADASAGTGVRILVVRPGFVTTKMTVGLKPAPMATTVEAVAEQTVRAMNGRGHTVWVPARLRYVFAILRHVPRPIYRRLPL